MFGRGRQAPGVEILGMDGPPPRTISRAEYLLLVAAMAQKIVGSGKTPTSGQVRTAETKMKTRLARRNVTVSGQERADQQLGEVRRHLNECAGMGWEAGAFWSKVKNVASTAARASKPYLPPAAAATSFVIKAVRAREAAKRAQAAQSPAEAPMTVPEAEGQVPQDEGLETLMGLWGSWDEREVIGGVTAEERELAVMGGSSEREAMSRRCASMGGPYADDWFRRWRRIIRAANRSAVRGSVLPHDLYRAAVWQRAQKLKKTGQPQARALFIAQKSVDRDMSRSGVSVGIPGARPGRITR